MTLQEQYIAFKAIVIKEVLRLYRNRERLTEQVRCFRRFVDNLQRGVSIQSQARPGWLIGQRLDSD